MILKKIELNNFRLCKREVIDFSNGVNLLYGKNAEGKTNILEAIYFFARGKSFRGGKDTDIVRFGENGFSVKIEYEKDNEPNVLEYRFYDGQRKRISNDVKVGIKEFIGKFNAVLFCPDHLSIIKDAPSERREFLNIALSQISGRYVTLLAEHKKLLEGKNALLKSDLPYDVALMDAYNEKLSDVCASIYEMRRDYIKRLSKSFKSTIKEISGGKEEAEIFYKSDIEEEFDDFKLIKEKYSHLFKEFEKREQAAKMSLCGIQRDDLTFTINKMDARQFASQGQQRSLSLALKIAEGEIISDEKGESPVYLFDDVLGELDEDRKRYVLSKTEGRQIIVTACEKGDYINLDDIKIIYVEGGTYREELKLEV